MLTPSEKLHSRRTHDFCRAEVSSPMPSLVSFGSPVEFSQGAVEVVVPDSLEMQQQRFEQASEGAGAEAVPDEMLNSDSNCDGGAKTTPKSVAPKFGARLSLRVVFALVLTLASLGVAIKRELPIWGQSPDQIEKSTPIYYEPSKNAEGAIALSTAAARGSSDALVTLATSYDYQGQTQKALETYELAVRAGNVLAMHNLAGKVDFENGSQAELEKSFQLYSKAAKKGFVPSQINLADMYESGLGTKQDHKLALKWQLEAALKGNEHAAKNVGIYYARGIGERNIAKSIYWFRKAAVDMPEVNGLLGDIYFYGVGGVKDYKLARHYYSLAAEIGHDRSMLQLGLMMEQGLAFNKDVARAKRQYARAAKYGSHQAALRSGSRELNDVLQLRWLAEQGDANAAYLLGRSIEQGIGGDSRKERDAFLLWYRVAAAMGQPETAERLKKLGVPASIANHKWPLPKLPAQMPPNVEWNPETVGEQSTNSDSNKIYARGASS